MIAHRQPASTVSFSLADLNSRLRALAHHQLASLNDTDKSQVLRIRAEQRGYHLSDSVVEYWLRRGPTWDRSVAGGFRAARCGNPAAQALVDGATAKVCARLLTGLRNERM